VGDVYLFGITGELRYFLDNVCRQAGEFTFSGDSRMHGVSFYQELGALNAFLLSDDAVIEFAFQIADFGDGCFDGQQVVIESGSLIAGPAFGYREDESELFNVIIGTDPCPHQFGSADLKIAKKICVVDYPSGVGISVKNPYRRTKNVFRHDGMT